MSYALILQIAQAKKRIQFLSIYNVLHKYQKNDFCLLVAISKFSNTLLITAIYNK